MSAPDEWISIKDFTPGIFDKVTPNNPIGTATREHTYRCIASENGALVAMPLRVGNYRMDNPGIDPEDEKYFIGGLFVADPIFDGTTPVGPDQNNSDIFVGLEWFEGDDRYQQILRYRRQSLTQDWELIYDTDTPEPGLYDTDYRPSRCVFQSSRSNQTDSLQVGVPIVVICYDGILVSFPNDTNPGLTDTFAMPKPVAGNPQPSMIVAHQNRIVVFVLTLYGFGTGEVYATNEGIYYTAPNDVSVNSPGDFTNVVAGSENPTGYQTGASLTANELLLLKSKGGALMMRGSMENPTNIMLPNVMSPGFSDSYGTQSPIGYAYCVDNGGVWVWGGGDKSEDISLALRPNFWRPTDQVAGYFRSHTTMTRWRSWIVAPKNWIYDIDNGGWWLLEDPDLFQMYHMDVDWTGRWLYGSRHMWLDGDNPPVPEDDPADTQAVVFHEYDRQLGALSYEWQSHPIMATSERNVNVREVIAVLSGVGTVTISVFGREGVTDSQIYTIDSDFPVALRKSFAVKGSNIQVRILSVADAEEPDVDNGAPTVHEVRLGIDNRERIER